MGLVEGEGKSVRDAPAPESFLSPSGSLSPCRGREGPWRPLRPLRPGLVRRTHRLPSRGWDSAAQLQGRRKLPGDLVNHQVDSYP